MIDFDATVQLFVLVLMFIISKDPCTVQLICPIICLHVELSVGQHYTLLFLSMYLVWSMVITSLSLPPQRSNVLKLTSHYFSCWKCASNFKSFILSMGKSSSTCKQTITKFSILSNTENSRLCLEPPLSPYRQCFQNFQTIFFLQRGWLDVCGSDFPMFTCCHCQTVLKTAFSNIRTFYWDTKFLLKSANYKSCSYLVFFWSDNPSCRHSFLFLTWYFSISKVFAAP